MWIGRVVAHSLGIQTWRALAVERSHVRRHDGVRSYHRCALARGLLESKTPDASLRRFGKLVVGRAAFSIVLVRTAQTNELAGRIEINVINGPSLCADDTR